MTKEKDKIIEEYEFWDLSETEAEKYIEKQEFYEDGLIEEPE